MAVFAAQHQSVACDTLKMNQLCKVCGEPAAGFHFGAFTCEGCKSFFGRSYNNLSVISECKNGGQCVINKKNRTSCKACRLRKCLLVGMSKSGSRYGRRSNWFKLHCLMQEQGPVSVPTSSPASSNNNNSSGTPGGQGNGPSPNSTAAAAEAAAAAFRRGFHQHHHHQMMLNGLSSHGTQPSSMSSNESISKDDPDGDCKNSSAASPRTSVSSPGSHHSSDSSLELMDHTPSKRHMQHHHGLPVNPFSLNLKQPFNPADFFPPLAMPGLLPPHLQAAAAAAAAAANLHGFYPTHHHSLGPAPRLLFPTEMAFPSVSSNTTLGVTTTVPSINSRPLLKPSSSSSSKKFNIESMLLQHQLPSNNISKPSAVSPVVSKLDEQDSPMDLSVRNTVHQRSSASDRDSFHSRDSADEDEFGDDSNAGDSDTLNDEDDDIDHLPHSPSTALAVERKPSHPLDLTRK